MARLAETIVEPLRDLATHTPIVRRAASFVELGRAAVLRARRGPDGVDELASILKAARLAYPFAASSAIGRRMARALRETRLSGLDFARHFPETREPLVRNGIILKAPAAGERGVLLVTFEDQWLRLLRHANLGALARDYELVLSPTWSPPYDLAMAAAVSLWPGERVFTLLSNFADQEVYARFSPKLRPVPLLASSWVDPTVFTAEPAEKEFDVVMVANFSPYKRHGAFFAALAALRRLGRRPRVLLAGVPWQGRTATTLLELASRHRIADQITVRVNLGDAELRAAIRSARTAVIFSLIEGSCVAAAECLLLGVPLGMLADAHIGSKAFVNPSTGRLLRPGARNTALDLARFLDEAHTFRPREWMLEHGVTFTGSTRVLNAAIRDEVLRSNGSWTSDIVEHRHVRLRPRYADPDAVNRFAGLYESFYFQYQIMLELNADAPFRASASHRPSPMETASDDTLPRL
jgi:glycosyltransferase involved in cell wall biosynthesis